MKPKNNNDEKEREREKKFRATLRSLIPHFFVCNSNKSNRRLLLPACEIAVINRRGF
jgi:hypothetical protein